ncbi:hypothetical protein KEM55_001837 [Ascosphaera atra]|nr:hypothetical protein KEM55_001837 [Ascosphaera atra]
MLLSSSRYRHGKGIGVGDFILFRSPYHLHDHSAKRVVGMPGDLVLRSAPRGDDKRHPEDMMIEVPEGHVWVIGDNLPWSRDSHMYGPIPMGMIKGKILAKAKTPFGWERIPNSLEPAQFAGDQ